MACVSLSSLASRWNTRHKAELRKHSDTLVAIFAFEVRERNSIFVLCQFRKLMFPCCTITTGRIFRYSVRTQKRPPVPSAPSTSPPLEVSRGMMSRQRNCGWVTQFPSACRPIWYKSRPHNQIVFFSTVRGPQIKHKVCKRTAKQKTVGFGFLTIQLANFIGQSKNRLHLFTLT